MRNLQVSYFRVGAMMIVIIYHCLCYYGVWADSLITNPIYVGLCKFMNSIDMPVFFIISGFLYADKLLNTEKYNNSKDFLNKKVKRLLIPYLFWGIVINILFINRYHFISMLDGISHLWFLLTLLMVFIIVHLMREKWIIMKISSLCILVFILLLITPLRILIPFDFLTIKQILQYLPYFFIGIIFSRSKTSMQTLSTKKYKLLIFLLCSVSLSIFLCFYTSNIHLINTISKYIIIPFLSIIVISSSWILCQCINFKEVGIIRSLDKNSMGIYIIHHILIIAVISNTQLSVIIGTHYIISPILLFFVVLLTSWWISLLINRYKVSSYILG